MFRGMGCAMAFAVAAVPAYAQTTEQYRHLQQRVERLEGQTKARGQGAFNPDISVILQGTAASIKRDPETYEITGFVPSGGEVGPPRRGFSLSESELVLSGNVDPYFGAKLIAALTPEDEIEVEEAFFTTLALGRGLTSASSSFSRRTRRSCSSPRTRMAPSTSRIFSLARSSG